MNREEEGEWVWVGRPGGTDAAAWRAAAAAGLLDEEERPLKVVFTSPAPSWTDAAPLGNGHLGAMVWGGVASETIQLNPETREMRIFCADDTLWTGVPGDYTNPDAPAVLAKVRSLVDSGDYAAASVAAKGLTDVHTAVRYSFYLCIIIGNAFCFIGVVYIFPCLYTYKIKQQNVLSDLRINFWCCSVKHDGKTASVSYSTTMDIAIIKEVFSAVISSDKIKTPWPVNLSFLGLSFGWLIVSGDAGPGWSTTWKMALWARLRNSDHAYTMIKQLIILVDPNKVTEFEGGLYTNLFTAHPPFQIDANFGYKCLYCYMYSV
ncbi:hypothetical protein B296_00047607 [Ensete ventricosum]|uniref:Uncharacterized protein n=1 Tax=Ensete ventricosum TaxID=4639 RepID=A0A426X1W1_ENSVE|nr:hypothetical protein B296_00047607 [Ensete ventricosum]